MGTCCFCGEACNWQSQSCGRCARRATMNGPTLVMGGCEEKVAVNKPDLQVWQSITPELLELAMRNGGGEKEREIKLCEIAAIETGVGALEWIDRSSFTRRVSLDLGGGSWLHFLGEE